MNWVITMNIAIWLSTASTVAIAFFAFFNYRLASAINERDTEYKDQTADLYRAIVIATAVSSAKRENLDYILDDFRTHYERAGGKTEIFPKHRES